MPPRTRSAVAREAAMDTYPTWGEIEYEQTDINLLLRVSDALRLRDELPLLVEVLADVLEGTPEERQHKREAREAVERLLEQLKGQLRPYGTPESVDDPEPGPGCIAQLGDPKREALASGADEIGPAHSPPEELVAPVDSCPVERQRCDVHARDQAG
jgi:hypothetical protein